MTSPRVWLITGASSGIGRSMTEVVLQNGDIAVATLRKPEVLDDLSSKYPADRLLVVKVDVRNREDIINAFTKTKEAFGRLDVVFNNAATFALSEVEGTPEHLARGMFDTNFFGATWVSIEAIKFFRDVNQPGVGGTLLNVSSMVGFQASAGVGFYSATKFALEGITEALSKEIDPKWNIKMSLIELGPFRTPAIQNMVFPPVHPAYTDPTLAAHGLRKQVEQPEEIDGDADKATVIIYKFSQLQRLPLRLPLSKHAVASVKSKLAEVAAEVDDFASWSEDLTFT